MDNNKNNKDNNFIIIIHGDIDLNLTDGCTIWLSNLINTLNQQNKYVIYLNTYKINNNNNFTRNIENEDLLEIINCANIEVVKSTINQILEYTNEIENIIVRSNLFLNTISYDWKYISNLIIYGLDIHLDNIIKLNNNFREIWTQSQKLKDFFISNGIDSFKIKITPPLVWIYNFNILKNTFNNYKIFIYAGTLRDEENILEILSLFLNHSILD